MGLMGPWAPAPGAHGRAEGGEVRPRVPFSFLLSGLSRAQRCRQNFPISLARRGDGRAGPGGTEPFCPCLPRATVPEPLAGSGERAPRRPAGLGRGGRRGPSSGSDVVRNADLG